MKPTVGRPAPKRKKAASKPYQTPENEQHLLNALCAIEDPADMRRVLSNILTPSEHSALLKRWTILRLLRDGIPQREIARQIDGSLCNVTRGARLVRSGTCAAVDLMDRLTGPCPAE
ncbi:MAG: trp operon repressor [Verrucomicrobiota bacterium]|jgi:TrpR family trp operon transcriptional repressor|nr:trp operon repressor [Verrucomicrobiota bacterium]